MTQSELAASYRIIKPDSDGAVRTLSNFASPALPRRQLSNEYAVVGAAASMPRLPSSRLPDSPADSPALRRNGPANGSAHQPAASPPAHKPLFRSNGVPAAQAPPPASANGRIKRSAGLASPPLHPVRNLFHRIN